MIKKQTINLICIFLVMAVIMSSMLVTAIVLFSPESGEGETQDTLPPSKPPVSDNKMDISLEDLDGLLNLNGMVGLGNMISSQLKLSIYKLRSTENTRMYLRIKSFGNYNGSNSWQEAREYTEKINSEYSAVYLTSDYLKLQRAPLECVEIDPAMNQYILPYYASSSANSDLQISDVICSGDASSIYRVYYYSSDGTELDTQGGSENNSYELRYREYVHDSYLSIDGDTLEFMAQIIKENGFSVEDPEIIHKVADYVSGAAEYDMQYDRALDREDNVAVAFLGKYKTGICQHYATAATLLFRALGIPARYTVGFVASTKADRWVNVTSKDAHAWVEVYTDGVGWQYVEVTGSTGGQVEPPVISEDIETPVQTTDPSWGTPVETSETIPMDTVVTSTDDPYQSTPTMPDVPGGLDLSGGIGAPLVPESEQKMYGIKPTVSDRLYFRVKSFGVYDGVNSWNEASEYTEWINSEFSAIYLAAWALDMNGISASAVQIEPYVAQYIIPYYLSVFGDENIQRSDTVSIGSTDGVYKLYFHSQKAVNAFGRDSAAMDAFESKYREFVYSNYLFVDEQTLTYMKSIIEENCFSADDPDIINKVASFIKESAIYDLDYDKALDLENNVAVAFLETYKSGVCQHYASAATLLFRALGIPARYTVGFAVDAEADQWNDVTSKDAHAWVEVYVDNVGWTYVEVTGSANGGGSGSGGGSGGGIGDGTGGSETLPDIPPDETEPKPVIKITPVSVDKIYDGTPLAAIGEVVGLSEYEKLGYTYSAVVSGERTDPGKSESFIEGITLYAPDGTDVTDQYEFQFRNGVIHVYLCELTVTTGGAVKEYDGTPLTEVSYLLSESIDHRIEITVTGSQTNVGKGYNSFTVSIFNDQNQDITDCYKIQKVHGVLEVTPRRITLRAEDAQKKYDGTPLECNVYALISGELASGDIIAECNVVGSQTAIGRSDNVIDIMSIIILNEEGKNVTGNYSIILVSGILRVTP